MSPSLSARRTGWCLAAAMLAAAGSAAAGPPILEREIITLAVAPLEVTVLEPAGGLPELRVDPRRGATAHATLAWPGPSDRSELTLVASERPAGPDGRRVALTATLTLPDGRRVRAERAASLDLDRLLLMELHRVGRRPLTLSVRPGVDREPYVDLTPTPGRPVRIILEVQRVDGDRVISLETNQLQAFVGRSVAYSFRMVGENGDPHAVRVRLQPERVRGALATIRVEVEGSLPDEHGPALVARGESLVISRGATSTLAVETGSPPRGYRFLVTAGF